MQIARMTTPVIRRSCTGWYYNPANGGGANAATSSTLGGVVRLLSPTALVCPTQQTVSTARIASAVQAPEQTGTRDHRRKAHVRDVPGSWPSRLPFAMRNNRTMFLFTFADDDPALPSSVPERKAALIERFSRSGWECPRILEALQTTNDVYFDRVSQIAMARLPSRGRTDASVSSATLRSAFLSSAGRAPRSPRRPRPAHHRTRRCF